MLLIYTDISSPRALYSFNLVITELLGIAYSITENYSDFKEGDGPKISYCNTRIGNEFYIQRCSLLIPGPIISQDVSVGLKEGQTYLFPTASGSDLAFDIFAASFYMVSRYEEYLPYKPDGYGRFQSTNSLAFRHNFLDRPVVNEWALEFGKLLTARFPELKLKQNKFSALPTYDIDVAYQYKGRGLVRSILTNTKDLLSLKFKRIKERYRVLSKVSIDPSDTYDYILDSLERNQLRAIFFFLVGSYSTNDKNIPYTSKVMIDLVKRISSVFTIGIHPSFVSPLNGKLIREEKERLETISGTKVYSSRQHFLKLLLPHTYLHLIAAGIVEDYSMAFADAPGFRAGICTPYYFYDLAHEETTGLKIFPVTCMEGNFIKYQKLTPQESIKVIKVLINRVKAVGGTFISIWHNHTLSNTGIYNGWKTVHDQMIHTLADKTI